MRSSTDKRADSTDMSQSADTRTPAQTEALAAAFITSVLADYESLPPRLKEAVILQLQDMVKYASKLSS